MMLLKTMVMLKIKSSSSSSSSRGRRTHASQFCKFACLFQATYEEGCCIILLIQRSQELLKQKDEPKHTAKKMQKD